jgi:cystathionine beta-lyase
VQLEGGQHALLQPSGLAAIINVYLAFLKQGDAVLVPDNVYSQTRESSDWLSETFGIQVEYYDPMGGTAALAARFRPQTRLLWLEAPGSVTMEIPDIRAMTNLARTQGIVTALDNTYSAGLAFKPFEHGVDVSMQALTKYQSGGSDVLMGATITNDAELHLKLKQARRQLGYSVSSDDCALVLRSLPSMQARFAAHDQSALQLARWLKTRPEVAAVLHPALPDCPGHAHYLRDFQGAGGLFSVVFDARYTQAQIDAFVEGLQLFKLGWSWGGAYSLVMPYEVKSMRTASHWSHAGGLVRFFIGLEDVQDLHEDIEQSLMTHLTD